MDGMQGDWRGFRATPEDRAGDALAVEEVVRLAACPYRDCSAEIGAPCRSYRPASEAKHGAFVHPGRATAAGRAVLQRTNTTGEE